MSFINVGLTALAVGLMIPIAMLFLECCAAAWPGRRAVLPACGDRPGVDILMPAHNESAGLKATLDTILPQLTEQDACWVIADNCSDDTARIAEQCGVHVLERNDPQRRGKGYALDYGLSALQQDNHRLVLVIDADCTVGDGAIDRLARLAAASGRPIQACYLMQPPEDAGPRDVVSGCAVTMKNLVRPLGLAKVGLPCLLTGSGMAFRWADLCQVQLASGNIVEDMRLSVDLLIDGPGPLFCREARISAALPGLQRAATTQRTRWEHGHLMTLLREAPRLLWAGVRRRRPALLAAALDLSIPPLSLLVMAWSLAAATSLVVGVVQSYWPPAAILAASGVMLMTSIGLACWRFSHDGMSWKAFIMTPWYVVGKLPIYLAFLVRPQHAWVRTERNVSEPSTMTTSTVLRRHP